MLSLLLKYIIMLSNGANLLTNKLLSKGYRRAKLVSTFEKFHGRHHDNVNPNNMAVSRLISDSMASVEA